jgi:Tfp pilus assembly protein PilF
MGMPQLLLAQPTPVILQLIQGFIEQQIAFEQRPQLWSAVEASPDSAVAWTNWCLNSYRADESEETMAEITKALIQLDAEVPELLALAADIQYMDAQTGLKWMQRPGAIRERRLITIESEEDYCYRKLQLAEAYLRRYLAVVPDEMAAIVRLGQTLQQQGNWAEALSYWQHHLKWRWHPEYASGAIICFVQLENLASAREQWEQAMAYDEQEALFYFSGAELLEAEGDDAAAFTARKQGIYYSLVLPENDLPYTAERWAVMATLMMVDEEDLKTTDEEEIANVLEEGWDEEAHRLALERQLEQVETLKLAEDSEAVIFLSSLVWSHAAHGSREEEIVDWLATAGHYRMLYQILDHAEAACVRGNALRGLASMSAPGIFDRLVNELPNDAGLFSMEVIESLQLLNDPRTPEYLLEFLTLPEAPRGEHAIAALANHEQPEVRARILDLEVSASELSWRLAAKAVLYRWTFDKNRYKELRKAMRKYKPYETFGIAEVLGEVQTKEAQKLVKSWIRKARR